MTTKARYDEFQLAKRHKVAYQTLILLFALIWINGFVKSSYGVWAEPFLESLVLMVVPGLYFAGRSIWQSAYIRANDRPTMPILMILLTGSASILNLFVLSLSVYSGTFRLVEDDQLAGKFGYVLVCLMFTMIFVLLVVRRTIDRNQ